MEEGRGRGTVTGKDTRWRGFDEHHFLGIEAKERGIDTEGSVVCVALQRARLVCTSYLLRFIAAAVRLHAPRLLLWSYVVWHLARWRSYGRRKDAAGYRLIAC